MAKINLKEINQYIQNFYKTINIPALETFHAERIKQWLVENLSNIGRYAVRDFERTGNLKSLGKPYNDNRPHHFDRSDGWVSLTEEVHDIDHLTYGTGALWIHGEMELPLYWPEQSKDNYGEAGDHIYNDEFHHCNYSGTQKHIWQTVKDEVYEADDSFWYQPLEGADDTGSTGRLPPEAPDGERAPDWGEIEGAKEWKWGYLSAFGPVADIRITNGTFKGRGRSSPVTYGEKNVWLYDTITYTLGGDQVEEVQGESPDGDNDDMIYHLGNERNNYPWRIVNGSTPKSVYELLKKGPLKKKSNGMYDGSVPELAEDCGTWPPLTGIKYVKGKEKAIVDFISPVGTGGGSSRGSAIADYEYARAFYYREGIDVYDKTTWPPPWGEGPVPREERAARGFDPDGVGLAYLGLDEDGDGIMDPPGGP